MKFFMALVVLGIAIGGSAQPSLQDPPRTTFKSSADAVVVDVSVRGRNRQPIAGLNASDFELYDNGVRQQVDQVSYGKLPIDVTVALDVSASVTGALLDRLRQGVVTLTRGLGPQDRLRLVLFNVRIARTVEFTRDSTEIDRALRDVRGGGGTALLDALSVAMTSASDLERRQLLVAFTDGNDSVSTTSPATLIDVAQRSRSTVTLVMPAEAGSVMTTRPDGSQVLSGRVRVGPLHTLMTRITVETGGSIIPVDFSSGLSAAFQKVLDEFRSAYVLYYRPAGVDRSGYHAIEVKVKGPGDRTIQARRGYFGS